MNDFRITIPLPAPAKKISYRDRIMLTGSCFAEAIGERLRNLKFSTCINPHGILYNAASIALALDRYASGKSYSADDLHQHAEGNWFSYDHHGRFNGPDRDTVLNKINQSLEDAVHFLRQASWLFITLGSGYGWYLRTDGKITGNCHRMSSALFNKRLIPSGAQAEHLGRAIEKVLSVNPQLRIMLTLSPVRYIRDGIIQNNLGKAHSLIAIHELCSRYEQVDYFPAYELVHDDLRDYRFFKEDMVHPSAQAVDYVYQALQKSMMDEESREVTEKVSELLHAMQHRMRDPGSATAKAFLSSMYEKAERLLESYPELDLSEELNYFAIKGKK